MVALLPKTQIESFNIDTVEKAIVFGALALRAALVGRDNSHAEDRTVVIGVRATGETSSILSLELSLPYDSYGFNTSGGLLLDSIQELTSNATALDSDLNLSSQPSQSDLAIPDYPETIINTFEQYLLYYCNILWASVANKRDSTISFTLLGNQEESQLLIRVALPLDLDAWLLGGNYLNSISTVVEDYRIPAISPSFVDPYDSLTFYTVELGAIEAFSDYELFPVPSPGTLTQIKIEADFPDPLDLWFISIYIDGVEAVPDTRDIQEDLPTYFYYDAQNPNISIASGAIITLGSYGFTVPTYLNLEVAIAH